MHPLNQWRLNAGIPINHELEVKHAQTLREEAAAIKEAREVPMTKAELTPKTAATMQQHINGVEKAVVHLKNAVKALERIPAHDFNGEIPYWIRQIEQVIDSDGGQSGLTNLLAHYEDKLSTMKESVELTEDHYVDGTVLYDEDGVCWEVTGNTGEGDDEVYHLKCPKSGKTLKKKYSEIKDWKKGKKEDLDEMFRYEREEHAKDKSDYNTADDFKKGEKVMYDNGIWVVHIADAQADLVGIIPPTMVNASEEEKAKAMQQVKRDKIRKPTEEECELMAGPDGVVGTADDMRMESTHNYTKSNAVTHDEEEASPINVVTQSDKDWANSLHPEYVKDEYPAQLDQRGDQSMDDYVNKVKVPAKVKEALNNAIAEFEKDAKKFGNTQTDQENRNFYIDAAEAFKEIKMHLEKGTIQGVKEAQVYATSLMGPMLHKLPEVVWDFLSHGGEKRSLKDYMNKVEKFPIKGPRNTIS